LLVRKFPPRIPRSASWTAKADQTRQRPVGRNDRPHHGELCCYTVLLSLEKLSAKWAIIEAFLISAIYELS
jgi:hypothetical protein